MRREDICCVKVAILKFESLYYIYLLFYAYPKNEKKIHFLRALLCTTRENRLALQRNYKITHKGNYPLFTTIF